MDNKSNVFEEYQNLRRTNPDLYYKPTTQQRMLADARETGFAFYKLEGAGNDN
jgi:hypothetical protein|tara:strand:- start:299 stop:457 length:159 start_codon:yes stop_codon:yes gene_type:complete